MSLPSSIISYISYIFLYLRILGRVLLGSTVFSWLGWLGFFVFYWRKNRFRLVWLINFFNRHQTKALAATAVVYAGHLKSAAGSCCVAFLQLVNAERSGNNYSKELPRFNRKRLEKCAIGKPQPLQPKLVAVETVDPNKTRPKSSLV